MSRRHDGDAENFPRMSGRLGKRAHGDQGVAADAFAGVQQKNDHAFTIGIEVGGTSHVCLPIIDGILGALHPGHRLGCRAFPQGHQLPLFRFSPLTPWKAWRASGLRRLIDPRKLGLAAEFSIHRAIGWL